MVITHDTIITVLVELVIRDEEQFFICFLLSENTGWICRVHRVGLARLRQSQHLVRAV